MFGKVPVISFRSTNKAKTFDASEIMQSPVVSLKQHEDVKTIYETLLSNTHNGFPVINSNNIVVGMISR
jgi:CBS domain-containing protein